MNFMKKVLLSIFVFLFITGGCDYNQDYFFTENLIGKWEGKYQYATVEENTYVEYTFKPDGRYLEAVKRYGSNGDLIGYTGVELGSYSVENERLKNFAHGGFISSDPENLPKTLETLMEREKGFIIDGFGPGAGYFFEFDEKFKTLYIHQVCKETGCTKGPPLVKKLN